MTVIDQRILVVAPSEAVWLYLTDPAHISKWNRSAKQLSMITTRSGGVGARRRCVDTSGRAVVEEMTAWLENIGYEYTIIDGPYRSFKGRLRLQPVPEGTLVYWTIEYQLRGFLSALRDLTRYHRKLSGQMADSLRSLRRLVEASGIRLDPDKQAKFAMQADPGIAARIARSSEPTRFPMPAPMLSIGDDDLPDLPIAPPTSIPTYVPAPIPLIATQTPVGMAAVPAATATPAAAVPTDAAKTDTKPRPPPGLREYLRDGSSDGARPDRVELAENPARADSSEKTIQADIYKPYTGATVPASLVAPPRPPDPATETLAPIFTKPAQLPEAINEPISEPIHAPINEPIKPSAFDEPTISRPPLPPSDLRDTGEMSIWDVFGMERPSDRSKADLDAVIATLQTPPPQPAARMDAIHEMHDNLRDLPVPRRIAKTSIRVRRLYVPTRARASVHLRTLPKLIDE